MILMTGNEFYDVVRMKMKLNCKYNWKYHLLGQKKKKLSEKSANNSTCLHSDSFEINRDK